MRIALIGYGEVGRILAEDLVPQGHAVTAYDLKLETEAGNPLREHAARAKVALAGSHTAAVIGAELILSAVTARQAVAGAEACAPAVGKGPVFLDFSSASPGAKPRARPWP